MSLPKPYYQSDRATLYCGDCLEILPHLGKVDAVVTDPPYGNGYSTGWRKSVVRSNTRIHNDVLSRPLLNDVAQLCRPLLNDVAQLCRPLLNDVGHVYWFAAPDRLDWVLPILRGQSLDVVNVLCWDKGNGTAGDLTCSYGKQWEAIVFARTQRAELIGGRDRDVIRISRGSTGDYVHPTQKPIPLIEYLIGRHDSETILDPFTGSGTTGVACIKTGRKFIGIEIDEKYCAIAARRIREAEESIAMFTGKEAACA